MFCGGVEGASIKIGPIFFGSETGCYQCLNQRLKSNSEFASHQDAYEDYLIKNEISAKMDSLPGAAILYELIGNYAVLEILKFFEKWAVPVCWKTVVGVNIFTYEVSKHTLLRVPYCESCKPKLKYNLSPWLEPLVKQ